MKQFLIAITFMSVLSVSAQTADQLKAADESAGLLSQYGTHAAYDKAVAEMMKNLSEADLKRLGLLK